MALSDVEHGEAHTAKSPPRPEPGGPGGRRSMLRVDPIVCGVYCYAKLLGRTAILACMAGV